MASLRSSRGRSAFTRTPPGPTTTCGCRPGSSAPGYCYLIALNPDGSIQLCPKARAHIVPGLTDEIIYPAEDGKYYGLTDGTGLQAFVLVASHVPLPAFDSWPARAGLSWSPATPGEAWRYDGHDFTPLGERVRGIEREVPTAAPAPFAAVLPLPEPS